MKIPRMLWLIAFLLFLATALNYGDRLALGIVTVDISKEFNLDVRDYADILVFFFIAYAIMYAGSGYLVDRLGTKRGFALFVLSWSIAQMLHAFTVGKWSLGACRFFLGLSEPGNWPAAAKAVQEWFPPRQRALGVGIFNAGSSLGSALAPPVVAAVTIAYGWRAAFLITGAVGLVWVAVWLIFYDPPERNRWLPAFELAKLRAELPAHREVTPARRVDWRSVIARRGCWVLILARFFADPVIYFVIFWLPPYLRNERHFDLAMVGRYSWVPYIFGGIAYVVGGWLSGLLIQRGWTLPRARKFVMLIGSACMPVALAAPYVPAAWMAIAATCFITFGHGFWVSNQQALPTDLFPGHEVGTASGFSGMGGAVGGALAALGTGYLVSHFSYAPVFILAGLSNPIASLIICTLLPDKEFKNAQA